MAITYKFTGEPGVEGPYLNGVPKRDLTLEDFEHLDAGGQTAVTHSDLYQRVDGDAVVVNVTVVPSITDTPATADATTTPKKGNGNATG